MGKLYNRIMENLCGEQDYLYSPYSVHVDTEMEEGKQEIERNIYNVKDYVVKIGCRRSTPYYKSDDNIHIKKSVARQLCFHFYGDFLSELCELKHAIEMSDTRVAVSIIERIEDDILGRKQ